MTAATGAQKRAAGWAAQLAGSELEQTQIQFAKHAERTVSTLAGLPVSWLSISSATAAGDVSQLGAALLVACE